MRNYLVVGLVALSAILTGCTSDEVDGGIGNGEGTISVKVVGSSSTRATANEMQDSKVDHYKVYVFAWGSGKLEADKEVAGTNVDRTVLFEGLSTASTKRVVVLANLSGNYPEVENYSELSDATNRVDLDRQHDNGVTTYLMSGQSEAPVQLREGITTVESIGLKRVVAKISLGSITIVPAEGTDISKFRILGFAAQRVTPEATLAPVTGYYETEGENAYHYGGFESGDTRMQQRDYLWDDNFTIETDGSGNYTVNEAHSFSNSFLVFPNQSDKNCTLFTIQAEYAGAELFFPIKVNYDARTDEEGKSTNGGLIESNNHYTLHITLKNISDGTTDPEVPAGNADLEVVVEVEPWAVVIQHETW